MSGEELLQTNLDLSGLPARAAFIVLLWLNWLLAYYTISSWLVLFRDEEPDVEEAARPTVLYDSQA